jgi:hypothetical protein
VASIAAVATARTRPAAHQALEAAEAPKKLGEPEAVWTVDVDGWPLDVERYR